MNISLKKSLLNNLIIKFNLKYACDSAAFTLLCVAAVSKHFNRLSLNNSIWRRIYFKHYPEQNPNLKVKDWHMFFKARYESIQKNKQETFGAIGKHRYLFRFLT